MRRVKTRWFAGPASTGRVHTGVEEGLAAAPP